MGEIFVNESDTINLKKQVLKFLGKVHYFPPALDTGLLLYHSLGL